jgi:hypothetical protein
VSPDDAELERLAQHHPGWQIWRVDRYLGGPAWCARPRGCTRPVLNADTPKHLGEAIEEREAGWLAARPPRPAVPRRRRRGTPPG